MTIRELMRQIIQENIRFFAECTSKDDKELYTIFVMEVQDSEDYSEKWKKKIISFAICDKEAVAVLDKDFHVFDNEGEARVEHYGIDQAPMEKMVNYTIAKSSLKKLGKEIYAAKDIFDEATKDIVRRYWHRTIFETQQQYIEAIKTEYNGRTIL